jgi:hypothetical protein
MKRQRCTFYDRLFSKAATCFDFLQKADSKLQNSFGLLLWVSARVARFFDTIYQKGEIYTKLPLNYQLALKIPNGPKVFPMTKKKHSNILHSKALQKLHK